MQLLILIDHFLAIVPLINIPTKISEIIGMRLIVTHKKNGHKNVKVTFVSIHFIL